MDLCITEGDIAYLFGNCTEPGRPVNAKRIRRLMREYDLVTVRRVQRARPRPHPLGIGISEPSPVSRSLARGC